MHSQQYTSFLHRRREALYNGPVGQWASFTTVSTDLLWPTIPLPEPASLTLQFETELKFPVSYKNESRIL